MCAVGALDEALPRPCLHLPSPFLEVFLLPVSTATSPARARRFLTVSRLRWFAGIDAMARSDSAPLEPMRLRMQRGREHDAGPKQLPDITRLVNSSLPTAVH
ncbi:unnamed protein product [Prorocentrum cordatum]|uniref:Uncharacterized protein n=1 Tax=Prorocentrum cordatum TaxID=2364126 RepID=A0ABN9RPB7_9DINO|nr:unnamed protein product [Polarella glacialis]